MLLYCILWNAEGYVRCRTSAIPYDYWCMGKEEKGRMGDTVGRNINNSHSLLSALCFPHSLARVAVIMVFDPLMPDYRSARRASCIV
jgi:hypothetical protein